MTTSISTLSITLIRVYLLHLHAEGRCNECYCVTMLSVLCLLSFYIVCCAECHYAEYYYAECYYAECYYAECCFAESQGAPESSYR